ncbi:HCP-like protein [Cryphonectria parasitica EP155]|uniref:HCP-like protein n=1 Tax=Cryphonectria parasitica (strain ATCC 38755 / EP155) TaxID=660469 RepID=A0A9P4XZ89_CRYP1|nr:HCP-like protein [Cryphonectria parasitica EP155]KAF3763613.1 HCP-like protein [Cryphonectria parasitica EP155]
MPQFGATFVPGGHDDYQMPQMYAPSPQRVMPEVPQNMQQGLQRMELEAREVHPRPNNNGSAPNYLGDAGHVRGESLSNALSGYTDAGQNFRPFEDGDHNKSYRPMADYEAPGDSPFPRVKGENIPPSDKEKEEILYNARQHVLHSNNVSMQLTWARDSLNYVETAAEVRTREARDSYGARPQTPVVEHDLKVDAMSIVGYLVDQNHPEAIFMKAKWDEFGKFGERQDRKAAFKAYRQAAEGGWARAEYRMGMLFENSNDIDSALKHYHMGLSQGDSAAMYRLGMMALLGQHGQRQDFRYGIDLINRAADTADEDAPQGAYVYGMLIARDLPDIMVPDDLLPYKVDTARQYVEKAAYLGFSKAQLKMGQAYELCQLGCDFNPSYSLHYYGLAAAQGQPEAALGVSRWFLFGYESNFAKNEALAFKFAKQAADAKLATGEFAMGYYHEIGIHVPKDLKEARRWYEQAASHGNQDAVGRLDSLSKDKSLSKKDHETTALTRIKSQHGSMRGKRPERLQRMKDQQHMAPLPEAPRTPNDPSGRGSPRISPNPSPRHGPVNPDGRPPAFGLNVNVDHGNLAMRPKSAAPYPDDENAPPLNMNRPSSAAPYPDDGGSRLPPPSSQRPYSGLPPPGRPDPNGPRPGSAGRLGPGPNLAPGIIPAGMPLGPGGAGRGRMPSTSPYPPGGPAGPGGRRQGSMSNLTPGPGPGPGRGPKPMAGPGGNGKDNSLLLA